MTDFNWEITFELSFPVERVWKGYFEMEGAAEAPPAGFTFVQTDPAGTQVEVLEVVENERFVYSDAWPGGTATNVIVFEATETGTRIVVTRSGFGEHDPFGVVNESQPLGWEESFRDLAVFLETGVKIRRHLRERSSTGIVTKQTPAGLVVVDVAPGGTGAEAGLQPGDLLVSIDGAAVYQRTQMWFVARLYAPGAEVEIGFVRNGQLMSARAHMSEVGQAVAGELGLGPRENRTRTAANAR
jgi:uncharacterized protein YndB with AHSA1/START domain